jgi:hypothetical protein
VKKKKVREKGLVIVGIPSWRKRPETTTSCGLENPIHEGIPTKKGRRQQQVVASNPIHEGIPTEKGRRQQQVVASNPTHEGIPTEKARDSSKLWPRILSTRGFPPKKVCRMISRKRMRRGLPPDFSLA